VGFAAAGIASECDMVTAGGPPAGLPAGVTDREDGEVEGVKGMPLEGVRVLDMATLFAGPMVGTIMADFGADVIKIEHPKGEPVRSYGRQKNGVPLVWKVVGRNKRDITLNCSKPEGREILLKLVKDADVLIENFRPGTLEKWGLGPDQLHQANPGLIILRTTGFGQFGPYSSRPGFGTIAESMCGFAHITGEPDGPPTLPGFMLADNVSGLAGTIAVMFALYHRVAHNGKGQVIDLAIIEPMLTVLGQQPTLYDQLGIIQNRAGNRSANTAPRNVYKTKDGKWVGVSATANSIAERVMRLVGHPEYIEEPWFATGGGRRDHADELDAAVGGWIAQHDRDEVIRAFEEAEAAIAPIYDISDIFKDPQYQALQSIISVPDEELGQVKMQNVMFRMSETPGRVRWAGKKLGADNAEVYGALGFTPEQLAELKAKEVI